MTAYTLYCTDCETETFTDSSGRCSCGSGRVMVQWQDKAVKTKVERQPNLESEERKELGQEALAKRSSTCSMDRVEGKSRIGMKFHIGQLRHLYKHLISGTFNDPKQLAEGLLSPVIQALEKNSDEIDRLTRVNARLQESNSKMAEEWSSLVNRITELEYKYVDNTPIGPCPFGVDQPDHGLEMEDPCPVCGMLGTPEAVWKCIDGAHQFKD